jgi:hypothetical protein
MNAPWRPDRRAVLLAPLAGAACSTLQGGQPADEVFRNIETPSESVHSGVASDDGERRLTVRLCRYPALGLAWLWVHAHSPRGFFSYVEHQAPCGRDATPESGDHAYYVDSARTLEFERLGPVSDPRSARVQGAVRARRATTSAFGPGAYPLSFTIAFAPARLYSGLNRGRTEVFGRSNATLTVDGQRFDIEGPAQFHEQRQTNPRFTVPFAYITLWGKDAAATLLFTQNRREGYLLEGDKATDVESLRLDPPGPHRTFTVRLRDGRVLEGAAEIVQAYSIPIVGQSWKGHMVRAELAGQRFSGHMNDFLSERVPYGGQAVS